VTADDALRETLDECPSIKALGNRFGVDFRRPSRRTEKTFLPSIDPETGWAASIILGPILSVASRLVDDHVYLPLARQIEAVWTSTPQPVLPAPGHGGSEGTSAGSQVPSAPVAIPERLTLDQAAALVHRSKRTLERYKTRGELPPPSVEGGGGRFDLWDWPIMRPWLIETFNTELPERFPARRLA
jgi:hypothetical protein